MKKDKAAISFMILVDMNIVIDLRHTYVQYSR